MDEDNDDNLINLVTDQIKTNIKEDQSSPVHVHMYYSFSQVYIADDWLPT